MSRPRGVVLFVVLVAVLGGLVTWAAMTLRRPAGPQPGTILVFDVPSELAEADPPYRPYSFESLRWRSRPTLYDVVRGLERAAEDDNVRGLVLHVSDLDWGFGRIEEVRGALERFRDAGKPIYASLTDAGDGEYLLASVAQRISAPPTSTLRLDGLSLSALFLKGTFDKIDVRPNFGSVGEFKSGVETFTRETMSESTRVALDAILDDTFAALIERLAAARGTTPDSMRAMVDRGPWETEAAHAAGLLDTLLYDAEVDTVALDAVGGPRRTMTFERYLSRDPEPPAAPRVALVLAEGTIARGKSRITPGEGLVLGAESLIEDLAEVRRRGNIRAVVLRIDSPGGETQASDAIWREVVRLSRVKPVVVSMSDVAASGGYYVAAGANAIVAQPGTLTGSIGIYGGKFNVLGLYRKLGLNVETLSRGRHAEMLSPFRDFTPEEARRFEDHLAGFYRGFLQKVAANRKRSEAEIDAVARGRVWTGRDAHRIGLVDQLGGYPEAFARARELAGLDPASPIAVERWPRREPTVFQQLLDGLFGGEEESLPALRLPEAVRSFAALAALPPGRALAILPFRIEID